MTVLPIEQIMKSDPSRTPLPHDRKYEQGIAFVNGRHCALEDAAIPIRDLGLLHGDAVYEVATISKGRFFRLRDHLDRFARSCAVFRLRSPYTDDEMLQVFSTLIRSTGLKDASLFWFVTRGLPKAGVSSVRDRNKADAFENRFYAMAYPYTAIATDEQRARGLDLMITTSHIRIPPKSVDPRVKNFHWMDMKLSLFEARDQGKDWSVLTDADGYLTESPGANIFLVKQEKLYTPDCGCLEGVTRKTVLELAAIAGISAQVEMVHARQLKEADEAFITSSAGGVMPINSVDDVILGDANGAGKLTTLLHNLYWEKMWDGWKCTPVDYAGFQSP